MSGILRPMLAIGSIGSLSILAAYFVTAPRTTIHNQNGLPIETGASSAIAKRFQTFENAARGHGVGSIANMVRDENDQASSKVAKR